MIEIIGGLPDNIVGIVVKGRVTKKDCSDVLVPAVEKARVWHHRLRLYYEIRSRFPGAGWEEISLGIDHAPLWERVAIVADVAWITHTVRVLGLLIPSEVRVFATSQMPEGLAWITGTAARRRRSVPVLAAGSRSGDSRSFRPARQYLHQVF